MIEKIGLGTVQFGLDYGISNKQGITGKDEVRSILEYARSVGIDLIDTAYGYGTSEEVLGKAGTGTFKIVSKFLPSAPESSIKNQVNTSLKRLSVNHLYGLLAHRPDDIIKHPAIWDYLLKLKQDKVVEKIGFSFNTPDEADIVLSKGFVPDLVQVPFNYLDGRFKPFMLELKKNACEVHTRSAFLQGLFFIDPEQLDDFFSEVKPLIIRLQSYGEVLSGLLLKYCLQMPFIDKVIIGVNNKEQLMKNIESIKIDETLAENKVEIKHEILTPSKWPRRK
jgi:aryl-alcohol dehydrogenase-like predicted oxidoreductase